MAVVRGTSGGCVCGKAPHPALSPLALLSGESLMIAATPWAEHRLLHPSFLRRQESRFLSTGSAVKSWTPAGAGVTVLWGSFGGAILSLAAPRIEKTALAAMLDRLTRKLSPDNSVHRGEGNGRVAPAGVQNC